MPVERDTQQALDDLLSATLDLCSFWETGRRGLPLTDAPMNERLKAVSDRYDAFLQHLAPGRRLRPICCTKEDDAS